MPSVPEPVSRVELRIQCRKLLNRDLGSKSDPLVILQIREHEQWLEVGRTEMIKDNLNPDFCQSIHLDYRFERVQKLKFIVYDIDKDPENPTLLDDSFLGHMTCTVAQIVSKSPFTRPLKLKDGTLAGYGTITVVVEEIHESKHNLEFHFSAKDLDKKDFLGKSDPFLEIFKKTASECWVLIHRTEFIKNTLNPTWKPFIILGRLIHMDNPEQEIKIICYDYDNDGSHDLIGEFETTVGEIMTASDEPVKWPCINYKKRAKYGDKYKDSGNVMMMSFQHFTNKLVEWPVVNQKEKEKKKKNKYKNSGVITLNTLKVVPEITFLDYIRGGCELSFTVGIDFTASNGYPNDDRSLHYLHRTETNEYMRAIMDVGNIIQEYDSNKRFPAFGFGAKIPPSTEVCHEFPINFNHDDPSCDGVEGILEAYKDCVPKISFFGPTNIVPIINSVAEFAKEAHQKPTAVGYYILLILTDGTVTELEETKKAIVEVSRLPMSIIIVGVGAAEFEEMEILDGDNGILRTEDGKLAVRDIVQFVPYRTFASGPPGALAEQVLAEIPRQITGYFKMRGILPAKPKVPSEEESPTEESPGESPTEKESSSDESSEAEENSTED